ncbi:MAG: NrfD/PsrC family molybdoenzyme membrane anchor subunit [Solirubrobacteraceae bacterium]
MTAGDHPLNLPSEVPAPAPDQEPPATAARRADEWLGDHDAGGRDMTPALGTRGEPASWHHPGPDARVALARPAWGDAGWSYLFGRDTQYADGEAQADEVAAANLRMRSGPMPRPVEGPFLHPAVWSWEVPVYFWVGGVASGAAFVALAADLTGDAGTAAVARKVALGAVLPAPALLIADLGRPGRFLNMLRVLKPRSPMNLGAWCLTAFSVTGTGAVAADLLGRRRWAAGLGAAQAMLGSYLGSYTGVLLAATAVPVWARSRSFLGPIFVATATATGAAATRLALSAGGRPEDDPSHVALSRLESGAILTELALSAGNELRLSRAGNIIPRGSSRRLFRAAEASVVIGLVLPLLLRRRPPRRAVQNASSLLYLAGGLTFRIAWVQAGKASALDDEAVAFTARTRLARSEPSPTVAEQRVLSETRQPVAGGRVSARTARLWSRTVGAVSLLVERTAVRVIRNQV